MIEKLKLFIKSKRISYAYLTHETGYTPTHISTVLTGKKKPSKSFEKLLILAVKKFVAADLIELLHLVESSSHSCPEHRIILDSWMK